MCISTRFNSTKSTELLLAALDAGRVDQVVEKVSCSGYRGDWKYLHQPPGQIPMSKMFDGARLTSRLVAAVDAAGIGRAVATVSRSSNDNGGETSQAWHDP
jgi:hypothetical protein